MKSFDISLIFVMTVFVVIIGIFLLVYKVLRSAKELLRSPEAELVKHAAKALQNGDINDRLSSTPRSLSSMNKIYLPQLLKDFPEFNWNEFVPIIEKAIIDTLDAYDSRNPEKVKYLESIYASVSNRLSHETVPCYNDVLIHDTVIKSYYKRNGTCYIITESSVEYYTYTEKGKELISGFRDRKKQTVYETELVYIQDPSKAEHVSAMGVHCPNCGAPITKLGAKFCEYCGSAVETVNRKVWKINSIKEEG